jgi:hypothetical protein
MWALKSTCESRKFKTVFNCRTFIWIISLKGNIIQNNHCKASDTVTLYSMTKIHVKLDRLLRSWMLLKILFSSCICVIKIRLKQEKQFY